VTATGDGRVRHPAGSVSNSMAIDPRTPVIVGVGQVTVRPDPAGDVDPAVRPEPSAVMVRAVLAAVEDCDGVAAGGSAPAGRAVLARATSLRVVKPLSWQYANPGLLVAAGLGIEPSELVVSTTGGDSPQRLVNQTALAVGRGDLDCAVLVGADCIYSQFVSRRHPDRPVLPWSTQGPDTPSPGSLGPKRKGTTDAEVAVGLDLPVHIYPLFENAVRAGAHRPLDEHRRHLGELWSRFSQVAADNPYAWLPEARTWEDIALPGEANRMVDYPYTKLLTANMQVDQGAALLLCSVAVAEAAGVPRDRWVFPLSGADADDHWYLSHRADFHSSPAVRLAAGAALVQVSATIDDVAHLDLYSCFPSAVEITAAELGLPVDDPGRPLTVTGGMTFAGGPGNNYGTHAIATVVDRLREDPGSLGLTTGVGWYLSRHSVGVYGTSPRPGPAIAGRPAARGGPPARGGPRAGGTVVVDAAGFRWADPQAAVAALPQCSPDAEAVGEVTVETYSVSYERDGALAAGVVACLTPDGRRAWARVTDPDHLAELVAEEGCGRLGFLREDGAIDLR